jgi:hypothetical protein
MKAASLLRVRRALSSNDHDKLAGAARSRRPPHQSCWRVGEKCGKFPYGKLPWRSSAVALGRGFLSTRTPAGVGLRVSPTLLGHLSVEALYGTCPLERSVFLVFTFEAIVFVCWSALVVVHHQTTAHLQERPEAECYTLQLPDTLGLILQPVRESTLHTVAGSYRELLRSFTQLAARCVRQPLC